MSAECVFERKNIKRKYLGNNIAEQKDMKNHRLILMMALMAFSLSVGAQQQRKEHVIDVGLGVGLGFYNGAEYNGQREQYLAEGWKKFEPVNEMFGLSAAYRIDRHWAVQLQGYRQRMMFNDHNPLVDSTSTNFLGGKFYYSPLWHIDVMGEYNILEYIPSSQDVANGSLTPYVGLGLGVALFDSIAHPRHLDDGTDGTMYPLIDKMSWGLYAVAGAGVKWHITDGWQLKAAINYQLHFYGNDRRGATLLVPTLSDELSHNITMSLSVLYALDFETIATGGRSAYKTKWRKNGMMWMDATDNYKGSRGKGTRPMKRRKPMWLD